MPIRLAILAAVVLWAGPAAAEPGDAARGEALFRTCAACHTTEANGRNRAGPRLHGLFGRKAGAVADYKYSPALKDSSLVWTAETVDALFDKGPGAIVPGSKMPLQVMTNAKDRADLIEFLKKVTAN